MFYRSRNKVNYFQILLPILYPISSNELIKIGLFDEEAHEKIPNGKFQIFFNHNQKKEYPLITKKS